MFNRFIKSNEILCSKVRRRVSQRSLDYRSGSVQLNNIETQNHSLTDFMNRIFFAFLVTCFALFQAKGQNSETLLTINGRQISKAEFEYIYQKNNNNVFNEQDKKSPKEYLDLFIDFKLKVIEAESLKMDTSSNFINELAGYRKEVAAPYLTDIKFNEQLIRTMYDRMSKEVNASHILLRVDPKADSQKKKEVLDRITAIRTSILNGKDFGEAAAELSEDPSAKSNKGNLGYFSAFMMVYPFENAAFNTAVREVSEPVESSFGYHIIQVHDMRKNQGEIQVAHIMKNIPRGASLETKAKLKTQIDKLYEQVKSGADFAQLAKKESDDKRTATKGGEMPWFSAGKIIPEFSKPAFALKNIGDFTAPVETKFGFHIIKKLAERPIPDFEEAKANIESKIKKDPARRTSSKKAFVSKLKKAYGFTENEEGIKQLEGFNIQNKQDLPQVKLFTLENQDYNTGDFSSWIKEQRISKGTYSEVYKQWVDDVITKLEDSKLEDKYPEFRYLMKEYHDGILLFNISQEKIWNFASEDSIGLQNFYEKKKKKHLWDERFKGSILTCKDVSVREKVEELFGSGMNTDEVLAHINVDEEKLTIEEGAWEKGTNAVVDYYVWNGIEPENFDSATCFIRGNKIEPEPKKLNEARGLYISDYQKYLEEQWLAKLRSKYKIKVNKKILKTIQGV